MLTFVNILQNAKKFSFGKMKMKKYFHKIKQSHQSFKVSIPQEFKIFSKGFQRGEKEVFQNRRTNSIVQVRNLVLE